MLLAELHGKVPSNIRRSEDVLTSHVFGVLEAMPTNELILQWLSTATNGALARLAFDHPIERIVFSFWPRLGEVEPDIVLVLEGSGGSASVVLVEAKYLSGPSGLPTSSTFSREISGQLGRQWAALRAHPIEAMPPTVAAVCRRVVIYLTADPIRPSGVLSSMIREVEEKDEDSAEEFRTALYWLSWSSLRTLLRPRESLILIRRLGEVLDARRLSVLAQATDPPVFEHVTWVYGGDDSRSHSSIRPPGIRLPLTWTYGGLV